MNEANCDCTVCGECGLDLATIVAHFKEKHPLIWQQVKETMGSKAWLN